MNTRLKSLIYLASFVLAVIIYNNSNKEQEQVHAVADITIEHNSAQQGLN